MEKKVVAVAINTLKSMRISRECNYGKTWDDYIQSAFCYLLHRKIDIINTPNWKLKHLIHNAIVDEIRKNQGRNNTRQVYAFDFSLYEYIDSVNNEDKYLFEYNQIISYLTTNVNYDTIVLVNEIFDLLTIDEALILYERFFNDKTQQEIAEELTLSQPVVNQRRKTYRKKHLK